MLPSDLILPAILCAGVLLWWLRLAAQEKARRDREAQEAWNGRTAEYKVEPPEQLPEVFTRPIVRHHVIGDKYVYTDPGPTASGVWGNGGGGAK